MKDFVFLAKMSNEFILAEFKKVLQLHAFSRHYLNLNKPIHYQSLKGILNFPSKFPSFLILVYNFKFDELE